MPSVGRRMGMQELSHTTNENIQRDSHSEHNLTVLSQIKCTLSSRASNATPAVYPREIFTMISEGNVHKHGYCSIIYSDETLEAVWTYIIEWTGKIWWMATMDCETYAVQLALLQ